MSKFLYPIFKLPNENDEEKEPVPTWIKWWLLNNYKKSHSWVLSEIITGNPLTLNDSVQAKFPIPPLPGGNSKQVQYSGKNKFNANAIGNSNITISNDGATITLPTSSAGGNAVSTSNKLSDLAPTLVIGQTYKILITSSVSGKDYIYLSGANTIWGNGTTKTITQEILDSTVYMYSTSDTNVIITNMMILLNSETDTTFEKYVGGTASPNPSYPQAISNVTGDVEVLLQNKNEANFEIVNTQFRVTTEKINANSFKVTTTDNWGYAQIEMNLKANKKYTIWYKNEYSNSQLAAWKNYNGNGVYASSIAPNVPTVITTTQEKLILGLYMYTLNSSSTFEIMILEGEYTSSNIPAYTPHKEQTYTFPLGTQRMYLGDYLADDGIHHVRKQVVFDGSENLQARSDASTDDYFVVRQGDYVKGTYKALNYSNYFKVINSSSSDTNKIRLVDRNGYGIHFIISKSIASTVDEFKTWLSTHNTIVELEPSTEEITPYTEPQQQAYDEIKQAFSYEEQTNISGSSDESNPLFEVQYYMKEGE